MSTLEIARQYGIHQETAWYFKRKVQLAMSQINGPLEVEILLKPMRLEGDEPRYTFDTSQSRSFSNKKSSKKIKKQKELPMGKEMKITFNKIHFDSSYTKGTVCRIYRTKGRVITTQRISLGFKNITDHRNMELFWYLHNLKRWMIGVHHRISLNHANYYFNEFQYRFERRHRLKTSFPTLLQGMIENSLTTYNSVKAK
jgi:hypothetical protein